jgi:hypothetical protein
VGFPQEPRSSVLATLAMARRLRAMSPRFEVAIFYFKPYPGNPIADGLLREGFTLPAALEEWTSFDYVGSPNPWLDEATRSRVEAFKFYQRIGWSAPGRLRSPLQRLARWRCTHDQYAFPVEKLLLERWRPAAPLS